MSCPPRPLAAACALLFALAAAPPRALADDPDPKEIVTKADADLKAGRTQAAIEGYERAQQIKPNSGLYFNLGTAWKQAGEPEKALDAFRTYLEKMPKGAKRADAQKAVAAIEEELAAKKKAAEDQAAADKLAADKAAEEKAVAERAAAENAAAAARVTVAAPAPAKSEFRFDDLPKKWWFWTAVGVVAAGAITGVVVAATARPGLAFPETGPGVATSALVHF